MCYVYPEKFIRDCYCAGFTAIQACDYYAIAIKTKNGRAQKPAKTIENHTSAHKGKSVIGNRKQKKNNAYKLLTYTTVYVDHHIRIVSDEEGQVASVSSLLYRPILNKFDRSW